MKVLLGRAKESVRVLIPDVKVADCGFHDVTLLDMINEDGPAVPVGDLCLLRCQWSVSVVSGMSRKQPDYELMRHECKQRFCGAQTGCCSYCGTLIKICQDMARYGRISVHLDLGQLWRCPVSWCTKWKGTPTAMHRLYLTETFGAQFC